MRGDEARRLDGGRPRADALEVEALRRALYASGPDPAAVRRYEQIASTRAEASGRPRAQSDASSATTPGLLAPPRSHPRNRRVIVLVAVALIVGFAAGGAVIASLPRSSAASGSGSNPERTEFTVAVPGAASRAAEALAIFEVPQQSTDRPAALRTSQLVASSFRRLEVIGKTGTALYAAQNVDHRYCLVEVDAKHRFAASCASEAGFVASPLTLDFIVPTVAESTMSTVTAGTGQTPFVAAQPAGDEILAYWSVDAGVGWTYTHG